MAYDFQTVELATAAGSTVSVGDLGVPASYDFALFSMWVTVPPAFDDMEFLPFGGTGAGPQFGFSTFLGAPVLFIAANRADGLPIGHAFPSAASLTPGDMVNLLCSIDTVGQVMQMYVNDVEVPLTPTWFRSDPMGVPPQWLLELAGIVPGSVCVGDVWFANTASFFDLSVEANRRKFIDGSGNPVDLGATGQLPLSGTTPPMFLHCGVSDPVSAFTVNLGSGGPFTPDLVFGACAVFPLPTPPSSPVATLAELFFSPTAAFADFSLTANREKFRSATGGTVNIGVQGATPFSAPAAVMLRAQFGDADAFADNDGFGGGFAITGGSLALAGSRPPCSETTVVAPAIQGAEPQIILSVSDDGGRNFTLQRKARSIGRLGEYLTRIRWLKLGQFRQRIIRLEITDPVRRNIVGFYTDVVKGME